MCLKLLKTTVLVLFFIASVSLTYYWFNYDNYDHHYDYSNVYEVTAIVKGWGFNPVERKFKDLYLELENGEVIAICIGGAAPDKIGTQRILYTDGTNYDFSKVAIVDKGRDEAIGCIVVCIIFTWVMIIVYALTKPKKSNNVNR